MDGNFRNRDVDVRLKTVIYEARMPDGRCYVGQTSRGLDVRMAQHIKQARCPNDGHSKTRFARALREHGPEAFAWRVLCVLEQSELGRVERQIIEKRGLRGEAGFNGISGSNVGSIGKKRSEATRAKIRAARARQVISPESYRLRGLKVRGRKMPEGVKAALREGFDKWRAENPEGVREARRKASESKRGRKPWNFGKAMGPRSAEARAKTGAALRGRALSEEHKRKIAAANRGQKRTAEQRERMSATKRGRPGRKLTPEQLANLIEAQHRWRREHPDEAAEKAKRHSEAMRQKFAARKAA